ncbi:MAG: class II aldolase/adducin family protein [Pseudomonadota bacterium]
MMALHPLTLEDNSETRSAVIDACLWMRDCGLNVGTAGNVSVRVGTGVLITPSGVPYEFLTPEMLQFVPRKGDPIGRGPYRPSSEWRFHQSILSKRPDMVAVVHAHPRHATALAIQRRFLPACHYMIAAFGGHDVPLVPYARFGSTELARDAATAMEERTGCLLANHGAITAGETLERALWRMQELETLAEMLILAETCGTPVILSETDIADVGEAFASYSNEMPG